MPRLHRRLRLQDIKSTSALLFIPFIFGLNAHAVERENIGSPVSPCAVVSDFEGEFEVLDASRNKVLDVDKHTGIPCGGWVSVENGWAEIRHRNGFKFKISADSFAQIPDDNTDGHHSGDHLVLYKGQALLQAEEGTGELRVITANARARVVHSTAILVFNTTTEETQLTSLESKSWLENRFEPSRKIVVNAGEATSLNFKLLRVVPTAPQVTSVASVKAKLGLFQVSSTDRQEFLENTRARVARRFAANLETKPGEKVTRNPASIVDAALKIEKRKAAYKAQNAMLHAHWINKMTAGEKAGEQILYPGQYYGRPRKVSVKVTDPAAGMNRKKAQTEDSEKQRLIEELSKIRE